MSRFLKSLLLVVVAALLAGDPIVTHAQRGGTAQPTPAGPFGALRWRSLGPPRGGRSIAGAGGATGAGGRPTLNRGRRERDATVRVLYGRDRWRPVEDDRWRRQLEAGDRRLDQ